MGTSPGSTGKCQPELPGAMYIKNFLGFYHVDMGEVYRVYRIMGLGILCFSFLLKLSLLLSFSAVKIVSFLSSQTVKLLLKGL